MEAMKGRPKRPKRSDSARQQAQRVNAKKLRERRKEEEKQLEENTKTLEENNVILNEMVTFADEVRRGSEPTDAGHAALERGRRARADNEAAYYSTQISTSSSGSHSTTITMERSSGNIIGASNSLSFGGTSSGDASISRSRSDRSGTSNSEGNVSPIAKQSADHRSLETCPNINLREREGPPECLSCGDSYELFVLICSSSKPPRFFIANDIPSTLPLYALPASRQNQPTKSQESGRTTLLGSDYDLLAEIEAQEEYYYITSPHAEDNYKILYISSALCELLSISDASRKPAAYSAFFTEDWSTPSMDHLAKAMHTGYESHIVTECRGDGSASFWASILVLPLCDKTYKIAHWVFIMRRVSVSYAKAYRGKQYAMVQNKSNVRYETEGCFRESFDSDASLPLWSSSRRDHSCSTNFGEAGSRSETVEGIIEQNRKVKLANDSASDNSRSTSSPSEHRPER
eukprot:gb/GECG01014817.1/.p1 GENE.gb/GECG01014817.1/~~gb/GECG01014817.1/.p1  ORF type:complete len:461 (+),score=63.01 gb/GECG01014817.1/:1-1383(+)